MSRDRIFVSYSHKDRKYLDELLPHLKALRGYGGLDHWSDLEIQAGADWRQEIEMALTRARLALMLVSKHYLVSDFIRNNELPVLLQAAKSSGVRILWIPLKASMVQLTPLAPFQAAWPLEKPLARLRPAEREEAWVRLCNQILEAERSPSADLARETPGQTDDGKSQPLPIKTKASKTPKLSKGCDSSEYEKAMKKIRSLLRTYAPRFADSLTLSTASIAAEVTAENVFKLETARAIIFGQSRIGKTTTINRLLDDNLLTVTGELTCTRSLAAVQHKGGLIFYDSPGIGDEPRQENVTRAALGLDQLPEEQVDQVRLLDITSAHNEGPKQYRKLRFAEYADEVGTGQRSDLAAKVVGKEFKLEDFHRWQAEHPFAFAVYFVGSERGTVVSESRLIGEFCRRQGAGGMKLFKVYNVFHDRYPSVEGNLASEVAKILKQAKERLEKAGVPDFDEWTVIDSKNGHGLDEFVRSFAESLPVEVLKHLAQVIRKDYQHLIQEKMTQYYKDYLALVASLIAVFPTDHSEGRIEFLDFLLASLVDVAELMASSPLAPETKAYANDIVDRIRGRSLRRTYERSKEYALDGFLRPISEYFGWYKIRTEVSDERFGVGGINSIRLVVPLGLAIGTLLHSGTGDFTNAFAAAKTDTERQIGRISEAINSITRQAGKSEKLTRVDLADELYPLLRRMLD